MKLDYYKILEVEPTSSADEIRRAYRRLAMAWHPDQNKSPGAEERFKEINEAYHVLIDEQSRKAYDQARSTGREWQTHYTKQDAERQFTEEMAAMGLQLAVMGVPLDDLLACLVYFGTPYSFAVQIAAQLKELGDEQIKSIAGGLAGESFKRILIGLVGGILSPGYGIANIGIGVYCFAKSLFIRKKGLSLDLPATENVRHGVANYHESQCPSCQQWHRTSPVFGGDRHVCPLCFSIFTISVEVPIMRVTVCARCHNPIVYANAPTPVIRCEKCERNTSADKHDAPVEKPVLICPHCSAPLARQDIDPKERHLYRCNKCHGVFVIAKHLPAKPCCPACKKELPKDISLSQDETPCQHCGAHVTVRDGQLVVVSKHVHCPACKSTLRVQAKRGGTSEFISCPTCSALLDSHNGDITLPACPQCKKAQVIKQIYADEPVRCNHCQADYRIGQGTLALVSFHAACPHCRGPLRFSGNMLNTSKLSDCPRCNCLIQVAHNALSLPQCPQCRSAVALLPHDHEPGVHQCPKCAAMLKFTAGALALISVVKTCPCCARNLRISAELIRRVGERCHCAHCTAVLYVRAGTLHPPTCPACQKPITILQNDVAKETFCSACGAGVTLADGTPAVVSYRMACPACAKPLRVSHSFMARPCNHTGCPQCNATLIVTDHRLGCPTCPQCNAVLRVPYAPHETETKCGNCGAHITVREGTTTLTAASLLCPYCHGTLKVSARLLNGDKTTHACPSCRSLFHIAEGKLHKMLCPDCTREIQIIQSDQTPSFRCPHCGADIDAQQTILISTSRVRACPHCNNKLRLTERFLQTERQAVPCPCCQKPFCVDASTSRIALMKS
jgi:hypothetical protein